MGINPLNYPTARGIRCPDCGGMMGMLNKGINLGMCKKCNAQYIMPKQKKAGQQSLLPSVIEVAA